MAIGTLAAIGIAAAAGGSVLSAKSKSKAATQSAQIGADTAAQNNALAREIYGKNEGYLAPYAQQGVGATSALNDFYGLSQPAQQQQSLPTQQPNALTQWQGYNPDSSGGVFGMGRENMAGDAFGFQQSMNYGGVGPYAVGGGIGGGTMQTMGQPAQPQGVNSADAFKRFIDNSDYAFQFGQGANRVNSGYAGAGTVQSGAAMKALEDYRQNLQAGYRGEWAGGVANQQGVGLAGASALAGVGQNYVSNISNNNNNAGTAAANAALAKGSNNGLANALGMIGGGLFKMGT